MKYLLPILLLAGLCQAALQVSDFNSNFDSGNLANVVEADTNSFTAEIETTYDGSYYPYWFCFRVDNALDKTFDVNFTNLHSGFDDCYYYYTDDPNGTWTRSGSAITKTTLTHTAATDTVYIARSPFTSYAAMRAYLNGLDYPYCSLQDGNSVQGRKVSALTITDPTVDDSLKTKFLITSGVHAGERNGQYITKKMMEWLVSSSAYNFRRKAIVMIMPQLNPDGIFHGTNRNNLNVQDLNRRWDNDSPQPEAAYGIAVIGEFAPDYGIDLHGEALTALYKQPASAVGEANETASIAFLNAIKAGTTIWGAKTPTDTTAPPETIEWYVNYLGSPSGTLETAPSQTIAVMDADALAILDNLYTIADAAFVEPAIVDDNDTNANLVSHYKFNDNTDSNTVINENYSATGLTGASVAVENADPNRAYTITITDPNWIGTAGNVWTYQAVINAAADPPYFVFEGNDITLYFKTFVSKTGQVKNAWDANATATSFGTFTRTADDVNAFTAIASQTNFSGGTDLITPPHGTASQDTAYMHVSGKINGALSCNGTSDYVDTKQTFESTFRDNFTISLWFNAQDGRQELSQNLFGCLERVDDEPISGVYMTIDDQETGQIFASAIFGDAYIGSTYIQTISDAVLPNGETGWNFVVLVLEQSNGIVSIKIYLNGNLVASHSKSGSMADFTNARNLYIGAYNNTGKTQQYFSGAIDDFRIYNEVLTPFAIRQDYMDGAGRKLVPYTFGNWGWLK